MAGSPRTVVELDRAERRRAIVRMCARSVCSVAAIGLVYFGLPSFGYELDTVALVRLVCGIVVLVLVVRGQVRRIHRSLTPQLEAIESVIVVVAVFLVVFASCYVLISRSDAGSFSSSLDRTEALYFTIATFGTVGYGDIAPQSHLAQMVVGSQILLDLVFLAVVVRLLFGASRHTLDQRPRELRDET